MPGVGGRRKPANGSASSDGHVTGARRNNLNLRPVSNVIDFDRRHQCHLNARPRTASDQEHEAFCPEKEILRGRKATSPKILSKCDMGLHVWNARRGLGYHCSRPSWIL